MAKKQAAKRIGKKGFMGKYGAIALFSSIILALGILALLYMPEQSLIPITGEAINEEAISEATLVEAPAEQILEEKEKTKEGLAIGYGIPEQGEVIVDMPVQWVQNILVLNPKPNTVPESIIDIELPKDATNLKIYSNGEVISNSPSVMLPPLGANETMKLTAIYETAPVHVEIIEEQIDISDIIPEQAFEITLEDNSGTIAAGSIDELKAEEGLSNITRKRMRVWHDSSMHYKNIVIPIEAGIDESLIEIKGESERKAVIDYSGEKPLLKIDEMSEKRYISMPSDYKKVQGVSIAGRDVDWELMMNGKTFRYKTPGASQFEEELIPLQNGAGYKKSLNISSDVHYENTTVIVSIPPRVSRMITLEWAGGSSNLFETQTDVTNSPAFDVKKIDTDNDGMADIMSFVVPSLSGSLFYIGAYLCKSNQDSNVWTVVGGKTTATYSEFLWTLGQNCSQLGADPPMNCFIANLSMNLRLIASNSVAGEGSYVIIANKTNAAADDVDISTNTPQSTAGVELNGTHFYLYYNNSRIGAIGDMVGPAWLCDYNNSALPPATAPAGAVGTPVDGTCGMRTDSFTGLSYVVAIFAWKYTVMDIFGQNYTWCWTDVRPYLVNVTTATPSLGWGGTFNWSIFVKDPNNDGVKINVTINKTGLGWVSGPSLGSGAYCTSCSTYKQKSSTYKGFNCGDILPAVYYMFNATDNSTANQGTWYETWGPDSSYSFAIIKDNITFDYKSGNMTAVARGEGAATLILYGNDTINQSALLTNTSVRLDVTTDGSTYTTAVAYNNSHPGDGNISFSFDPSCSYSVGLQKWRFYASGSTDEYQDPCYYASTSSEYYVNVTDLFTLTQTYPATNATKINSDDERTIAISGTVSDSCYGTSGYVSGANMSFSIGMSNGSSYLCNQSSNNAAYGIWSESSGTYTCTWNTTTGGLGWYNVTYYGSKPNYPYNTTNTTAPLWFKLTGSPTLSSPTVSPSNGPWGTPHTFSVTPAAGDSSTQVWVRAYISQSAIFASGVREIGTQQTCTGDLCTTKSWNYNFSGCDDKTLSGGRLCPKSQLNQKEKRLWQANLP